MDSYDVILKRMFDKYEERTGTLPDRASDIGVRMEVLAGEIFSAGVKLEFLKNQMFPSSAVGEYLDIHANQRGISRKQGIKAEGTVTFYTETVFAHDIVIPQGTAVSVRGDDPWRYVTTEENIIQAGRVGLVCNVEAVQPGEGGNAAIGEVTVLVTPIAGIERVTNEEEMHGGCDEETDEQLRKRIIDSFVNISNGTNKAYYIKSAMDIDGVSAAGVIPRNRGVGTVDVFIMSPDGEPSQTLIDTVQERLSELREINVDIHVESLTKHNVNISVNVQPKKGYSFNNIYNAVLQSINNYFAHLNAGESFYKSSVAEYIRHTEGVDNFEFILFRTPDVSIDANCIAWPGVITINPREDGV